MRKSWRVRGDAHDLLSGTGAGAGVGADEGDEETAAAVVVKTEVAEVPSVAVVVAGFLVLVFFVLFDK